MSGTVRHLVKTSGVCCVCDSEFTDEEVLAIRDRALPAGWAYYELRHLDCDQVADLVADDLTESTELLRIRFS